MHTLPPMHSPHPPATEEEGGIKTLGECIKPAHVGLYAPSPSLCGLLLAFPGLEFGLQTHLVITYVPLLEQGLISSDILSTFVVDGKYDILFEKSAFLQVSTVSRSVMCPVMQIVFPRG